MALEYVPVFWDWIEVTGELNDQEKGRLIDAMVMYSRGGDWQDRIKGNERYLFPAFRQDPQAASKRKQTQAKPSKFKQTQANPSKRKQTQAKLPKKKKKKKKKK